MKNTTLKQKIALSLALCMFQFALPALANVESSTATPVLEPVGLNQPVSVAVLDLESRDEDAALSQALADVLRIELFKAPGIQVLERSRLRDLLSEQRFQDSAYCGESCLAKAGKILGLDDVIVGAVHRIEGFYSIHLRIVNVATGRVTGVATAQCKCDVEQLLTETSKTLSAQLLDNVYAEVRMGKLLLQSDPAGAEVYYNSKRLGVTPLEFQRLPAGQHEFELVKRDFVPQKFQVKVKQHHLQRKTIPLTAMTESASLQVNSKPSGAKIHINGEYKGQTPLKIEDLPRGIYDLQLSHPGHRKEQHHVLLETGQNMMYDAVLQSLPENTLRTQKLRIYSQPAGAEVWIAGKKRGETPFQAELALQGQQEVQLRHFGYLTWSKTLDFQSGKAFNVEADLIADQQAIGLWTAAGVGMALLLGGLFIQRSNSLSSLGAENPS